VNGSKEVRADDRLDVLVAGFLDLPDAGRPGHVDQRVDSTEPARYLLERGSHTGRIANVGHDPVGAISKLSDHRVQSFAMARHEDGVCSLAGKSPGGIETHACGPTADHHPSVVAATGHRHSLPR